MSEKVQGPDGKPVGNVTSKDRAPARVVYQTNKTQSQGSAPANHTTGGEFFSAPSPPPYFGEALIATAMGIVPIALWLMCRTIAETVGSLEGKIEGEGVALIIILPIMLAQIGIALTGFVVIFLPWVALALRPAGWIIGLIWFAFAAFGLRLLLLNYALLGSESQSQVDDWIKQLVVWFGALSVVVPVYVHRRRKANKPPL